MTMDVEKGAAASSSDEEEGGAGDQQVLVSYRNISTFDYKKGKILSHKKVYLTR